MYIQAHNMHNRRSLNTTGWLNVSGETVSISYTILSLEHLDSALHVGACVSNANLSYSVHYVSFHSGLFQDLEPNSVRRVTSANRGGWTRVIKSHQYVICTNIKCTKHMAGINRAPLCLAKDAVEKELSKHQQTNLSTPANPSQPQPNRWVLRLCRCS